MKERVLKIQVMKTRALRDSKRRNEVNSSKFNNRAKYDIIVNTVALLEPFGNETGLVAIYRAINFSLDFIYPFAVNEISITLQRYQVPCFIVH
jgi:hypothetical protein